MLIIILIVLLLLAGGGGYYMGPGVGYYGGGGISIIFGDRDYLPSVAGAADGSESGTKGLQIS